MQTSSSATADARPSLSARFSLQRALSDILAKRWMETWIPLVAFALILVWVTVNVPATLAGTNLLALALDFALLGLLVLGLYLTVAAGGIDVSIVGSYAVVAVLVLIMVKLWDVPVLVAVVVAILVGAAVGVLNAALIVGAKTRPFLTTLVVMVLLRSVLSLLSVWAGPRLAQVVIDDYSWTFLGVGGILFIPVPVFTIAVLAIVAHVLLTRSRIGSRLVAVGANERSAIEAGLKAQRLKASSYVIAGALAGLAGVFYAVRFEAPSPNIGAGQEFSALAAIVLGGISLGGGRGSVPRALLGTASVTLLSSAFVVSNRTGFAYQAVLAVILLIAVGIDAKWSKHRGRAVEKLAIAPASLAWPDDLPDFTPGSGSRWAINRRLTEAEAFGLGIVEGAEDCIVDRDGNLYGGDRRGWVWKLSGPDHSTVEVFARTGGNPLGMAFDRDDNLLVCCAGRGLVSIDPAGEATLLSDQTKRSLTSIRDDSRLRLVDDLDVTPDGIVWFSEASKRFELHEWMFDMIEGRPNGRLLAYDPRTGKTTTVLNDLYFPNGVVSAHDGMSILVNSTTRCCIYRYWHAGPKKGTLEYFVDNLPGYPDNINRSADGGYWLAFVGLRNPAYDLAMQDAGMKRRMSQALPTDDWLFPNLNQSCLIKLDSEGRIVDTLWDETMRSHSLVTSMRESGSQLYIAGLTNDRIGRIAVDVEASCDCGQLPCRGSGREGAAGDRADAVVAGGSAS